MRFPPRVKICGLARREDAEAAVAAGAAYGGAILAPGRRRSVSPEQAVRLFEGLSLRRVGVFVDAPLEEVVRVAADLALDVVQLHGDEDPTYVTALRERGAASVWKALRPRSGAELADGLRRFRAGVDGILLDGWSPDAHGGTGAAFDWEAAAGQRADLPDDVDLIVAGGLRPENVARAVALLAPTIVDVSSGVETAPGIKDPERIAAFVAAARGRSENFSGTG